MPIIPERLARIGEFSLKYGSHDPDSTFCMMELVSWVAGEKWSASPECVCPVISTFLRSWSDGLPSDAERDRLLKPLVHRVIDTRNKSLEEKRAFMAADWLIRVHTPAWLRLAGLIKQAESLEQLPNITAAKQFPVIIRTIEDARDDAKTAISDFGATSMATAGVAAWDAAVDAAVGAARAAARAAAVAAAAAATVAGAGAGAGANLGPTVAALQQSALNLVEEMIAAE